MKIGSWLVIILSIAYIFWSKSERLFNIYNGFSTAFSGKYSTLRTTNQYFWKFPTANIECEDTTFKVPHICGYFDRYFKSQAYQVAELYSGGGVALTYLKDPQFQHIDQSFMQTELRNHFRKDKGILELQNECGENYCYLIFDEGTYRKFRLAYSKPDHEEFITMGVSIWKDDFSQRFSGYFPLIEHLIGQADQIKIP